MMIWGIWIFNTSPPNPLSFHATSLPGEGEFFYCIFHANLPSPRWEIGAEGEGSGVREVQTMRYFKKNHHAPESVVAGDQVPGFNE